MRDAKGRFCKAAKFNVGDRVMRINNDNTDKVRIGCVGTIVQYLTSEPEWATVKWDGIKDNGSHHSMNLVKNLAIYIPSPKFAVGDVVTIKGSVGEWTVEVAEANRYRCSQRVGVYDTSMVWAKPEDMKKVECVEQFPTKPTSSPQIGDAYLGSPVDGDMVITSKGVKVVNGYSFTDGSTASCAYTLRIKGLNYGNTIKPAIVPGSVVRLRSGGPQMSVESVDDYGMAMCVWLYGPAKCSGPFSVMCLEFVR